MGGRKTILAWSAVSLFVWAGHAADKTGFNGQVVGIAAGHAMSILANGRTHRVRLVDVQCPRTNQPFSKAAKKFTADEVLNQIVKVEVIRRSAEGVVFARVRIPGRGSLSELLVKEGLAWWNQKDAPDDRRLEKLEKKARQSQRGLWSQSNPKPPWN